MRRNQEGFTIIELVIVIAILGILGAVALPKFADLTTQARTAAFDGVRAGFTSGVMIVHSSWLAQGASTALDTIVLDGATNVPVTDEGWPTISAGMWGLVMSAPTPADWGTLLPAGTITVVEYDDGSNNSFTYDDTSGAVVIVP